MTSVNQKESTFYSPHDKNATILEKHPIIPPLNLSFVFELLANNFRGQVAIICDGISVTYDEFIQDYTELARAFCELGIKKGDIVTIPLPNNYQAVCSLFALNKIGAVTTFIDTYATESEIKKYLNMYQSPILINYDKSAEENERIKKDTCVKYIITLSSGSLNTRLLNRDYRENPKEYLINYNSLGSIAAFKKNTIFLPKRGNLDAVILYTSGSTGFPKSVVLTNSNILAAQIYAKNTSHTENITAKSTMTCVPLRYPYGSMTSLITSLLWGKTAIMTPDWNSATVQQYLKLKPNIIFGSPSVINLIMKLPDNFDLSFLSLFISGGDFLTPALYNKFKGFLKDHGAPEAEVGNGCGNAETVSIASTPVGVESKPTTAGSLLVGSSAIIIDKAIPSDKAIEDGDALKTLPLGEEGELCIAGKHVFRCYYGDPDATNIATFTRGNKRFFRTGTIGKIDSDGYFTPTNRKSRFYINDTGHKVYLDYVQGVIATACSEFQDVAAVSIPDNTKNFKTVVYVTLADKNSLLTADDIAEFCKNRLASPVQYLGQSVQLKEYEIPQYFALVEEINKIPGSDKPDYKTLQEEAINMFGESKPLQLNKAD